MKLHEQRCRYLNHKQLLVRIKFVQSFCLTRNFLLVFQIHQVIEIINSLDFSLFAVLHGFTHQLNEKVFRSWLREAELQPTAEKGIKRSQQQNDHELFGWRSESLWGFQNLRLPAFKSFRIDVVDAVRDDGDSEACAQLWRFSLGGNIWRRC